MKKYISLLLALLMVFSLTACAGNSESETTDAVESNASAEVSSIDSESESEESENVSEAENENLQTDEAENAVNNEDAANEDETDDVSILVAYFSATNTTEGVAEIIADVLGADLYEIVPEDPYTDADLNYNDDNSRTTIEMNDPTSRPAIAGSVENMEQYDIVFIGYPIWWGDAPRILSTFMESYDFSGKTIVPFCTSGGSGIGSSASNLQELTDGAEWVSGQRFGGNISRDEVVEWINGLGLDVNID